MLSYNFVDKEIKRKCNEIICAIFILSPPNLFLFVQTVDFMRSHDNEYELVLSSSKIVILQSCSTNYYTAYQKKN